MPQLPADPFEGVDWEDLHKRLLAVALRLSVFAGLTGRDRVLVGTGFSAEDLVTGTIAKALGGNEIRYRAEKGELFGLLKTALINDFLDLLRQSSFKTTDRVGHVAADAEEHGGRALDLFAGTAIREDVAIMLLDVKRLVADDPKLSEYVEAVELGFEKQADIATVCQVDVTDIYARKRRLKELMERTYGRTARR